MKQYLMYTYNLALQEQQELFENVQQASLSKAHGILGQVLRNTLNLTCHKNETEDIRIESEFLKETNGIFLLMFKRPKDVKYYELREKCTLLSHPACYVIMDNREGVSQLAIEKNNQYGLSHESTAKSIATALNNELKKYGLKIIITPQKQPRDFWFNVKKHVQDDNDPIQSIKLDFLDPAKSKINGGNKTVIQQILTNRYQSIFNRSTRFQIQTDSYIDKDDKEAQKTIAEIAGLCAVNSFDITLKFRSGCRLSMRDTDNLVCTFDEQEIEDFKNDKAYGKSGQTTSVEVILDKHRKAYNIA